MSTADGIIETKAREASGEIETETAAKLRQSASIAEGSRHSSHDKQNHTAKLIPLPRSKRGTPDGVLVGPSEPSEEISITVMVKSKASDAEFDKTIKDIADHKRNALSDTEFAAKFGANPNSLKHVLKFAADNWLKTESIDASSGRLELKGSVKDLEKAFGTSLRDYQSDAGVLRERQGSLMVPRNLRTDIEGVFGLDERVQAHSHLRHPVNNGVFSPRSEFPGYLPTEVARAYNFPTESMGAGQSVAILQFGGGLDLADNAKFYEQHQLAKPDINIIEVSGAHNSPGSTDDDEVTMDSQIIGSIAPEAKQHLIFSQDTEKGWIDAITRATFPEKGEAQNSVISISWGDPEERWTDEQRRAQGLAFKKAALKGISVFAASGDDGAKDGAQDAKFTTDYPSSDPYVTGSGGTNLKTDITGAIKSEVTWNDNDGAAGGGGISNNIRLPYYQIGMAMPPNANNTNRPGRGVPDISADASPQTGYITRTHGVEEISGGTSAVSPLFAALTLRINGALGHNVGFLNPFIYKNGNSGIFHDITQGNNDGYNAGKGWDAATGWGSPDGQKLLDALRKQ